MQAFCRFRVRNLIVQDWRPFLPREERDAARILSDSCARDDIEVRVEGGHTLVDLVGDDYHSTVAGIYIAKADGRQRPLGVPTMEDKIV